MTKYGTDENGWPLVPVDPAAIPEGYEPVRVGLPRAGELCVRAYGGTHCWSNDVNAFDPVRLIIRPVPKPIRLPTSIVPHQYWVVKDSTGDVIIHASKPVAEGGYWRSSKRNWELPAWIARQLPAAWHDLPWDKSAVQQTEGGEG